MEIAWLTSAALSAGAAIAVAQAATVAPAVLVKRSHLNILRQRCRGKLALTYDDGPGPLLTPPLMNLLDRFHARATFFLVGFRAQRWPEMCDLIERHGHELGCHTKMHKRPWRVTPWRAVRDMEEGYESLSEWIEPDASFRPPFGKLTTWTWLASRRRSAPLSFWTLDGGDTYDTLPDPAPIVQHMIDDGGAVVLLHSHDRGDDRHRYVLNITEQLLTAARTHGLQTCTMSELLNAEPEHDKGASNDVDG